MAWRPGPRGKRLFGNGGGMVLMLACLSCSKGTGTVSGTVTLNSKPLHHGTVIFHCPEGKVLRAAIEKTGAYTLPDVPVGPVQITVVGGSGRRLKMSNEGVPVFKDTKTDAKEEDPEPSSPEVTIPVKYRDPKSSGLTHTVEPGNQMKKIALVADGEEKD